jgi:glycerophosphodiester phosphodiesterase
MSLFSEVTNVPNVLQTALVPEDVRTKVHDWLFTARDKGHLSIVELLRKHDQSGWTPQEHAAYRGYVDIAKLLEAHNARNIASTLSNALPGTEAASLMPQSREHSIISNVLSKPPLHPPIMATQLLVNLGSFDTKNAVAPVDLDLYLRMNDLHSQAGLSIEISAIGANGPSQVMQLPIPEDVTNELWAFSTTDLSEVKLVFNILRQLPDAQGERQTTLIGRGIASLNDLKRGLGVNRESLVRDYSIAILEKDTLNTMGTVTFTFLVVKPFSHEQSTSVKTDDLWNKNGSTKVVGHRGTPLNYAPDAISMC